MKINENTKVKVRIPKELYESVKKELAKKSIQESKKEPLNEVVLSSLIGSLALPMVITALGWIIAKLKKNEATKNLAAALEKDVKDLTPDELKQAKQNAANTTARVGQRGI